MRRMLAARRDGGEEENHAGVHELPEAGAAGAGELGAGDVAECHGGGASTTSIRTALRRPAQRDTRLGITLGRRYSMAM